jgi:hypothetical protein
MTTGYSGWGGYLSNMREAAAWDTSGAVGQNPHADGTQEHEEWWASQIESPDDYDNSL